MIIIINIIILKLTKGHFMSVNLGVARNINSHIWEFKIFTSDILWWEGAVGWWGKLKVKPHGSLHLGHHVGPITTPLKPHSQAAVFSMEIATEIGEI